MEYPQNESFFRSFRGFALQPTFRTPWLVPAAAPVWFMLVLRFSGRVRTLVAMLNHPKELFCSEVFPHGGSQSCRCNVAPASMTRIRWLGAHQWRLQFWPPLRSAQVIADSMAYRGCLIGVELPAGDRIREVMHKPLNKQNLRRLEYLA